MGEAEVEKSENKEKIQDGTTTTEIPGDRKAEVPAKEESTNAEASDEPLLIVAGGEDEEGGVQDEKKNVGSEAVTHMKKEKDAAEIQLEAKLPMNKSSMHERVPPKHALDEKERTEDELRKEEHE